MAGLEEMSQLDEQDDGHGLQNLAQYRRKLQPCLAAAITNGIMSTMLTQAVGAQIRTYSGMISTR